MAKTYYSADSIPLRPPFLVFQDLPGVTTTTHSPVPSAATAIDVVTFTPSSIG